MNNTQKITTIEESSDRIDVKNYISLIKKRARKHKYSIYKLGKVWIYPILLLKPKTTYQSKKNILVISGFHGDEIAGPFGILQFLQDVDNKLFKEVNLSFIPLVNPTGFRKISRFNRWEEQPNRGYVFSEENAGILPSREDKILIDNIKDILELGSDGILSLHEDVDANCFYCYAYSCDGKKFISNMIKTGKKHFDLMPDGRKVLGTIDGGVVYDLLDGSFDHFASLLGIPTCTTETPGKQALNKRKDASVDLIKSFIESVAQS